MYSLLNLVIDVIWWHYYILAINKFAEGYFIYFLIYRRCFLIMRYGLVKYRIFKLTWKNCSQISFSSAIWYSRWEDIAPLIIKRIYLIYQLKIIGGSVAIFTSKFLEPIDAKALFSVKLYCVNLWLKIWLKKDVLTLCLFRWTSNK